MKTTALPHALLLCLGVACTHARTTASPRQEERAAQKADNESGEGSGDDTGSKDEQKSGSEPAKTDERTSATAEQATRRDGDRKDDADSKDKDKDDIAPEDIEVSTTPQGLLEPGAMDKVRDKLGVAKGESVQTAIRRFQREHDLPATGMLDHETVERLGLSPDEIFEQSAR